MIVLGIFFFELMLLFFLSRALTKSLSTLIFHLTKSQTVTIHILSLLFLPGVIIHELAHMLVASLLFVPVGEIEFFPKITDHGVKLGSVSIAKTDPMRRALIGFAPVFVGLSLFFSMLFYFEQIGSHSALGLGAFCLVLYTVFEVGNTMFSSQKDIEGTLELFGAIGFVVLLFFLAGARVETVFVQSMFSIGVVDFVQKANFFLSLPIVLDFVVWGLVSLVIRR